MKLTKRIQKAINKASVLHNGQKRKGDGLPFIVHPCSVSIILSSYTDNEDIIIAGLLHDVLEDVSGYSEDDMEKDFGKKIVQIVKGVSEEKSSDLNALEKKKTWQERKNGYLEKLKHDNYESLMVCAADKIHNISSLIGVYKTQGEGAFSEFNASVKKMVKFYSDVLKILKKRLKDDIVIELEKKYEEMEQLFFSI